MNGHVAIIGAGMAGLGASHALAGHGVPTTVFEMNRKPGGRMTTEDIGDFHLDVGASFVVRHCAAVTDLVRDTGMADELFPIARHAAALYRDGRFFHIDMAKPWTALWFGGLSLRAKLSVLGLAPSYVRHYFKVNEFMNAYKGVALDTGENAHEWLRRCASAEIADCLGDSVCRALTMYPLSDMGRLAFMVYSLSLKNMRLQTLANGMGSVPARIARNRDIRYGCRVTRVEEKGDRVEVSWTMDGREETADFAAAVLALWGDAVPGIVKGLRPLESSVLTDTRYSMTYPVAILLDRPLDHPFYGVYLAPGQSSVIASFGVEEAKGNRGVPPGKGCLFCLTREEFARSFTGGKEELAGIVLKEAECFFPEIRGHVTDMRVFKWDRAVEKFPSGRFAHLQGLRSQWPRNRRVILAGSYLLAPCTDAAFTSGVRAGGEVLRVIH